MTPTTKFQLAQMVRCVDGYHRGRVGFVLARGERSISVKVFDRATGESNEFEQQEIEKWEVVPEPPDEVAARLAAWRRDGKASLERFWEQQGVVQG